VAVLEAELATTVAMSMLSAAPMAIKAIGACTRMTMWREYRGLTIRHRSQSLTLRMNADELTVTAIPKWWISNPLGTLVIAEAISIAGVITTSRHQNR
jgi:hypothetical protein